MIATLLFCPTLRPDTYPAHIFGLAAVGFLRFRRQFSTRSAMIVTAIFAALIGMVIAL